MRRNSADLPPQKACCKAKPKISSSLLREVNKASSRKSKLKREIEVKSLLRSCYFLISRNQKLLDLLGRPYQVVPWYERKAFFVHRINGWMSTVPKRYAEYIELAWNVLENREIVGITTARETASSQRVRLQS